MKNVLAILSFATCWQTAAAQPALSPRLDSIVQQFVQHRQFSGTVLLAKGDQLLYHKAFGPADREKGVANQPTTNFNIASVGKTYTAALVGLLASQGKIDLQQRFRHYFPEFSSPNLSDKLTIHHLLTHTGGTNNYMEHPDFEAKRRKLKSINDVMPLVTSMPLSFQPGERYEYSNSGFVLLGKLIEKVTGLSYPEALQAYLFRPAGITNSYLHYPATFIAPTEAVPYYVFSQKSFVNATEDEFPPFSDGGMQSNVADMWQFAKWLLKQPETVTEPLWTQRVPAPHHYGYGWNVETRYDRKTVGHSGGGHGFSTDFRMVPADGFIVVVMANNRTNVRDITTAMLDLVYTGIWKAPKAYQSSLLLDEIDRRGLEPVKEELALALQRGQAPGQRDWIGLIDALSQLKRQPEALALVQLAAMHLPKESWPLNVAGNLYREMGRADLAKEYFQKALAVEPNNPWTKAQLEKL
ncbi:hypothetical protein GCM10023189_47360 [Nibrella saemangeumensis]|uniref:Beta-lactamase-related domain-containing protein n=1 Tax=Nibrella saemangeumensis TaxID=1084526 RepID=A0ABP8NHK4_9BACT